MEFDKEKYKVWELPHPIVLHWILNPGLAFNELVLGQRIPKVMLIDKTSDAPLLEKQYVPCPNCNALNDGRLWAKGNAFGHWFGYVCPVCSGRIPCLWNLTSLALLAVTFPIWIWFKPFAERKWLEREKRRFTSVVAGGLPEAKKTSWLKMGLAYGAIMFCFMALPKLVRGQLSLDAIAIQVAIWLAGGLAFSLIMKWLLGRGKRS